MRQNWRLKKIDAKVTMIGEGRYRVDAYLAFDAPENAHPDRYVGPLKILFSGEAKPQDLAIETLTINGREPDRRLIALQEPGTYVMASIEKPLRTVPWSVHLKVALNAERGQLAMPLADVGTSPVAVTIVRPNGETVKAERPVTSLLVGPGSAAPGPGWLGPVGFAVAAALVIATVFIIRRRAR